jgi:Integrase core domain
VEAFPWETAPRYLLRDRDAVYGVVFSSRAQSMGIHEVKTAPRSPWQNPFVERVIGSIRRECLDHFLILNETHLYRLLRAYVAYYNGVRPHQALDNNSPQPRDIDPPPGGRIIAFPQVGGLITVTSAPPDHPDRDPLVARLVLGRFTSPVAKIRAPSPNGGTNRGATATPADEVSNRDRGLPGCSSSAESSGARSCAPRPSGGAAIAASSRITCSAKARRSSTSSSRTVWSARSSRRRPSAARMEL